MASWFSWLPWGTEGPVKPMKPTDAMHHHLIQARFTLFLDHVDPPKSFKAAEVAQELTLDELAMLGYERWEQAVPAVIELAFETRALGSCEILKGGEVLPDDVNAHDIAGGIRIRRTDD